MKKLILWIIKTFKLDIPTEKIVEKVIEKQVLPKNGVIDGDLYINGHLIVINGDVKIAKSLTICAGNVECNCKED